MSLSQTTLAVEVAEQLALTSEHIGVLKATRDRVEASALQQQDQARASLRVDELDENQYLQPLIGLYQQIDSINLAAETELKRLHLLLMNHASRAGHYRSTGMGVYRDNRLVHMTAPANQASKLVRQLLQTIAHPRHHPLLHAANVLFDLEYIQPFARGNGVMARLWFKGILQRWRPFLASVPIESRLAEVQEEYYITLKQAIADNDNNKFIAFVLRQVGHCTDSYQEQIPNNAGEICSEKRSESAITTNDEQFLSTGSEKISTREKILQLLEQQPGWSAARAAEVLGISSRAVEKHISRLKRDGLLSREGSARSGRWRVTYPTSQQLSLPEY